MPPIASRRNALHGQRPQHRPLARAALARAASAGAALAATTLFLFGFGLDEGELDCERAVAHVLECCPDFPAYLVDCMQEGGCDRERESTLVTETESDCITAASCEEVAERGLCGALLQRREDLRTPDGPTLAELQKGDPLCD